MIEEEEGKGIQFYIALLKRNKNRIFLIWLALFIIITVIALKWPATYRSSAIILIEQQEIPQDLVRSTVTSYADQRIQVISQRVMSSVNLKRIIEKFSLYLDEQKTKTLTSILEEMREDISLDMISAEVVDPRSGRPTEATIAFSLSFEYESPKYAQNVANELVNLYLNENLKRRTEVANEATAFLTLEGEKLRKQIKALEADLAEFKENNADSLPEVHDLNLQILQRTENQINDLDRQLNSLRERKLYIEAELTHIDPNTSVFSATGERIYGSADRLKSKQAEYVSLKSKYADDHPDVIKAKLEIEALEAEVGGVDKTEIKARLKEKRAELAVVSDKYSVDHPDVQKLQQQVDDLQLELSKPKKTAVHIDAKPDNPAYIQLQTQLKSIEAEIKAHLLSKDKLLTKMDKVEQGLLEAPQVEREYRELIRDYDNATMKYREVKAKQMEADMAKSMEKDKKAERFSLIEPPIFPEEPHKPNRPALIVLGFILALGIAVGYAFLRETVHPAIYGVDGMIAATGAAPLVVIPFITNDEDLAKAKKLKTQVVCCCIAGVILGVAGFHFFIMPLDVLWYVGFRKLGISS